MHTNYYVCSSACQVTYTPNIDRATWGFLGLSDMRHDFQRDSDMGHVIFLKSTG